MVAFSQGYFQVYGLLLYYFGDIFDYVDGNLARYKNLSSNLGVYYDQIGHVITGPLLFLSACISSFITLDNYLYLYLGYINIIFHMIMSYQKTTIIHYLKNSFIPAEDRRFAPNLKYFIKKSVSYFYHFKFYFLTFSVLINYLHIFAIFSGIYFVVRFVVQLSLDKNKIINY